jgi:peptide/nickel transport system substrate-binding protein
MVFKLAPNIKWQNKAPLNGRAFTVDDVAYSFDRVKNFKTSPWSAQYQSEFDTISALPDGRVQLKLKAPDPVAEGILSAFYSYIVPKELGENPDTAKTTAVGTGSMMVKSVTPNVEWVFEKNPGYFKKDAQGRSKPYLDGFSIRLFADTASAIAAFETKQTDFTYYSGGIDSDAIFALYHRHPDLAMQSVASGATSFIMSGHCNVAPWSDPRVRRAFTMAVPYDKISAALYSDGAIVMPFFTWSYVLEKKPTVADLGPNYIYSPTNAKAMLAAAGFPNGIDIDVQVYTATQQYGVVLQQELMASGIRLNLVQQPDLATINSMRAAKNWKGLLINGQGVPYLDPAFIVPMLVTGNAQNFSDYSNATYDDLAKKFSAFTKDGPDRKAVAKQIWDQMLADVPSIPLPFENAVRFYQPKLKNWVETAWSSSLTGWGQVDSIWKSA